MGIQPLILLVPSLAAAVELPRRLAATGRAIAGLYPFRVPDLARAVAEPLLLGRGLAAWDSGHAALLAARLLDAPEAAAFAADLPRPALARALARTLSELRHAGADPEAVLAVAGAGATHEDQRRLGAVAALYRAYQAEVEGRFADPVTLLRTAAARLDAARWLDGAEVLVVEDLELDPAQRDFVAALARRVAVRRLAAAAPSSLAGAGFSAWAETHGIASVAPEATILQPITAAAPAEGLRRLRERLFEAPEGEPCWDGSVQLVTAASEAGEVRAIVRRLIREAARGVPFEEMGVALPRSDSYASLFTELFERVGIPYRLHPSLPLRHGRAARSLLLLLRCRALTRPLVMEFLTFAPVPFAEVLGPDARAAPELWDAISREAGIVSGLPRWILGLRAYAESQRHAADAEPNPERVARLRGQADDAEALLRVVELLSSTLDALSGEAAWPEWSERLNTAFDQWIAAAPDREAVAEVLGDLAGLGSIAPRASWDQVEAVLDARFEWERMPLTPVEGGALHVGAFDAIAGLPFRVLAIPGLVEGGFPGVLRPDPFLLDPEREALAQPGREPVAAAAPARGGPRAGLGSRPAPRSSGPRQLSLFEDGAPAAVAPAPAAPAKSGALATTQDRLMKARRQFHRALRQAGERLILSFPRADPRQGRARAPSLFFAAAASTLAGRPLGTGELAEVLVEDELGGLPLAEALDPGERDRARVRRGGAEAVLAVAAGSGFFRASHHAAHERWSSRLTEYDGLVADLPPELAARLDPLTAPRPVSASGLARYATCGFLYLLERVLGLEPALEPEERLGLDPLERGSLFHEVAECFLRERRDRGELPVRDDDASRERLLAIARERVDRLVAGTPPRHRLVWEMQWQAFEDLLRRFLEREAKNAEHWTPAHFELSFGTRLPDSSEPHAREPLEIDLDDGRRLRVAGKIDRIDVRPDGALVLRDYKTGRAPRDDGGVFRGGRQLQIPFYVLAAQKLLPGRTVEFAFLDYVDGGRPVAFDLAAVTGEPFRRLLREVTAAIAAGRFVQEPASCQWCDFAAVCGPQPLIERRRAYRLSDEAVRAYLRLRDYR